MQASRQSTTVHSHRLAPAARPSSASLIRALTISRRHSARRLSFTDSTLRSPEKRAASPYQSERSETVSEILWDWLKPESRMDADGVKSVRWSAARRGASLKAVYRLFTPPSRSAAQDFT